MQEQPKKLSVMVVEDEDELRENFLVPGLRQEGFDVHGVGCAMDLYRALSLRSHDLFIVDVGLPDESGFMVTQHLRKLGDVGIVMLTGRRGSEDHVRGLEEGADAYLAKPVGIDVLVATVRSVLRRTSPGAQMPAPRDPPRAGWSLIAQGWRLCSPSGVEVALSEGERQFLLMLEGANGGVVARDVVLQHLGSEGEDFDLHRLEMLIHRLRRKIHATTGIELPLTTVRGVGYLLLL
ncbi:MAG: response regulator transcription factor [Stenotrophomonas sp.]